MYPLNAATILTNTFIREFPLVVRFFLIEICGRFPRGFRKIKKVPEIHSRRDAFLDKSGGSRFFNFPEFSDSRISMQKRLSSALE